MIETEEGDFIPDGASSFDKYIGDTWGVGVDPPPDRHTGDVGVNSPNGVAESETAEPTAAWPTGVSAG